MTNNDTLNTLRGFFSQIYQLGSDTIIYTNGAVSVSLNDFLLVLILMTIVLMSLVNFVKIHGASAIDNTSSAVKSYRQRKRENAVNDFGSDLKGR